ncbi:MULTISPECIES: flagellar hook-associated protein FlgK [unclassified Xanthobacter]|uniref:flagellar hook-associated protein FlgK n=1 Tax=unclassified Xanthobacter TaxID=2623496 RepID=UPI001EE0773B|nr:MULTISPECIES: flagellar hook-associated protein FlgK [unclassified Xanthobacter]
MSLSLAFNTAQSALATTATQLQVSSRNVAAANDPSAARKIAVTTTTPDGSTRVVSITRAAGGQLFVRMLAATAGTAAQQAVDEGLTTLRSTVDDSNTPTSPAARIGVLADALSQAANTPDDPTLARQVVTGAQDLAGALNSATATVQQARGAADSAIASSVTQINDLLRQFQVENAAVVRGVSAGADITDTLDRRDAILSQLSQEIGISTVTRANNDIMIYTDSGATLFETTPRAVTFLPTPVMDATTRGGGVYVDGVAVAGPGATMPVQSGRIAGLTQLRDQIAPSYQTQLDEMARGLITAFAEADQSGAGGPALAGLFTGTDAAVPDGLTSGLAGWLRVNAALDPAQGGDPMRLRDGGINGAAYLYNTSGTASFSGRLAELGTALGAQQSFDGASGLPAAASLDQLATASVSWLEGARKASAVRLDSEQAVLTKATTALSAGAGVNLDQEYAAQLELERSYQASSKLIGVVGQLYDSLFAAIG